MEPFLKVLLLGGSLATFAPISPVHQPGEQAIITLARLLRITQVFLTPGIILKQKLCNVPLLNEE